MRDYDPRNWYWLADDGRIYSSAAGEVVTDEDKAFKAWTEAGSIPTPWPRDEEGNQTDAALQDVLRPYGLAPPISVSPLQIRKALRQTGLNKAADAFVETLSEEAQEEWEYATAVDRDHPFIVAATVALGKTEADLDDLFRLAATL